MYTIVDRYYMTMKERLGASLNIIQQFSNIVLDRFFPKYFKEQIFNLDKSCHVYDKECA
jgi:hypothetical protein